jgi:site-specific DNA-adenine methylase
MKYVGSKNRLAKDLVPIIQGFITDDCKGYLEPFVGGANMIDKINHSNKIGCDIHKQLIALLKYVQDLDNKLPTTITEDEYKRVFMNKDNYEEWYVGLVGFCATFGAKYFGGYARGFKADKVTPRDIPAEGIRNLEKQRKSLVDIKFENCSFVDLPTDYFKNYVIYCDIPYKSTLRYNTSSFPYDEFYDWCREMSKNNIVLISEYHMPDDFECIWSKKVKVSIDSNKKESDSKNERIEKLFMYKNGIKSL